MIDAGRLHSRNRDHSRREGEIALFVILTTAVSITAGVRGFWVALPGFALPAAALLLAGHRIGRRAGCTSVVTVFAALALVLGSDTVRPTEAALPALLGLVAWGVSHRIESRVVIPDSVPAASDGRWLTVEVEESLEPTRVHPVTIPATLIRGHDLHLRIARRRNLSTVAARRA